jgi:hypothetical protein
MSAVTVVVQDLVAETNETQVPTVLQNRGKSLQMTKLTRL